MTSLFITAIGTDVGKTYVASALAWQLKQKGEDVRAFKPVVSGFDADELEPSDTGMLAEAAGLPLNDQSVRAISPWRFAAPLSPHLAAEKEGKAIDEAELIGWCRKRMEQPGITLIEGVGGLMVPLTPDYLVIDWIEALDIPVILVGASYLGAINHTLLSIQALRARAIPIHAVVISQSLLEQDAGLEATKEAVEGFGDTSCPVLTLPRAPISDKPFKNGPDLLSLIV